MRSINARIIGPAGVGKSDLAAKFANKVQKLIPDMYVIDDYMPEFPVGQNADYHTNLWIHFNRFDTESTLAIEKQNFVTVGSDIETLAHALLYSEWLANQQTSPAQEAEAGRNMVTTQILTSFLLDFFGADYAWYIPLLEGEGYEKSVDASIRDVITYFKINCVTLLGTEDEKIEKMLQEVEDNPITE